LIVLNLLGLALPIWALIDVVWRSLGDVKESTRLTNAANEVLDWYDQQAGIVEPGAVEAEYKKRIEQAGLRAVTMRDFDVRLLTGGASDRFRLLQVVKTARSDFAKAGMGVLCATTANVIPLIWRVQPLAG
jgi:hypothetical protein